MVTEKAGYMNEKVSFTEDFAGASSALSTSYSAFRSERCLSKFCFSLLESVFK